MGRRPAGARPESGADDALRAGRGRRLGGGDPRRRGLVHDGRHRPGRLGRLHLAGNHRRGRVRSPQRRPDHLYPRRPPRERVGELDGGRGAARPRLGPPAHRRRGRRGAGRGGGAGRAGGARPDPSRGARDARDGDDHDPALPGLEHGRLARSGGRGHRSLRCPPGAGGGLRLGRLGAALPREDPQRRLPGRPGAAHPRHGSLARDRGERDRRVDAPRTGGERAALARGGTEPRRLGRPRRHRAPRGARAPRGPPGARIAVGRGATGLRELPPGSPGEREHARYARPRGRPLAGARRLGALVAAGGLGAPGHLRRRGRGGAPRGDPRLGAGDAGRLRRALGRRGAVCELRGRARGADSRLHRDPRRADTRAFLRELRQRSDLRAARMPLGGHHRARVFPRPPAGRERPPLLRRGGVDRRGNGEMGRGGRPRSLHAGSDGRGDHRPASPGPSLQCHPPRAARARGGGGELRLLPVRPSRLQPGAGRRRLAGRPLRRGGGDRLLPGSGVGTRLA